MSTLRRFCIALAAIATTVYLLVVRMSRNQRRDYLESSFANAKRPLSSMTTSEAYDIMTQLQELEFPYAFNKARQIALLKVQTPKFHLVNVLGSIIIHADN